MPLTLGLTLSLYALAALAYSLFPGPVPAGLQVAVLLLCLAAAWILSRSLGGNRPHPLHSPGWTALTPYLVLFPGFIALFLCPRMQVSHHGFFHGGYVLQALRGLFPPENPTLPGFPANDYWPYHALLASLVSLTSLPIPLVNCLLNLLVLAASLAALRGLLRDLLPDASPIRLSLGSLLALFSCNALGFFAGLANTHPWVEMTLNGDSRLISLYNKFLNFNAFPCGILLFILCLRQAVGFLRTGAPSLLATGVLGLGAILLHATTGLFLVLCLPAALACAWLLPGRPRPFPIRRFLGAGLLLALPLAGSLLYLRSVSAAMPLGPQLAWPDLRDFKSLLGAYGPWIPLLWACAKQRDKDRVQVLLLALCAAGLFLALFLNLPDANEYKFVLLLGIPLALVCLPVLPAWTNLSGWRRGLALGLLALVPFNLLLVGARRFSNPWFLTNDYSYSGGRLSAGVQEVSTDPDRKYADLFLWARDNTPPDCVLVLPLTPKNQASLYLLSQRLPFLVEGHIYNEDLPETDRRTALVAGLFGPNSSPGRKDQALAAIRATLAARPLLLLLPKGTGWRKPPAGVREGEFADAWLFPPLAAQPPGTP